MSKRRAEVLQVALGASVMSGGCNYGVTHIQEAAMTATTTLKLPDELKARIAAVAQQSGKSAHAFMVEALELQTELAERRTAFVADALLAREEVARYGLVVDADEVFDYLKARAEGKPARKPDPSSI